MDERRLDSSGRPGTERPSTRLFLIAAGIGLILQSASGATLLWEARTAPSGELVSAWHVPRDAEPIAPYGVVAVDEMPVLLGPTGSVSRLPGYSLDAQSLDGRFSAVRLDRREPYIFPTQYALLDSVGRELWKTERASRFDNCEMSEDGWFLVFNRPDEGRPIPGCDVFLRTGERVYASEAEDLTLPRAAAVPGCYCFVKMDWSSREEPRGPLVTCTDATFRELWSVGPLGPGLVVIDHFAVPPSRHVVVARANVRHPELRFIEIGIGSEDQGARVVREVTWAPEGGPEDLALGGRWSFNGSREDPCWYWAGTVKHRGGQNLYSTYLARIPGGTLEVEWATTVVEGPEAWFARGIDARRESAGIGITMVRPGQTGSRVAIVSGGGKVLSRDELPGYELSSSGEARIRIVSNTRYLMQSAGGLGLFAFGDEGGN